MSEDKKDAVAPVIAKPKDIGKISTEVLIKEFSEIKAALEVDLTQTAAEGKGFPKIDKDEMAEEQKIQAAQIEKEQKTLRKDMEAQKQDYRKYLEAEYRGAENTRNDPKAFQKALDEKKKEFEPQDISQLDLEELGKRNVEMMGKADIKLTKAAFKELEREWTPSIESQVKDATEKAGEEFLEVLKQQQTLINGRPQEQREA